jgi:hypothetical protein
MKLHKIKWLRHVMAQGPSFSASFFRQVFGMLVLDSIIYQALFACTNWTNVFDAESLMDTLLLEILRHQTRGD